MTPMQHALTLAGYIARMNEILAQTSDSEHVDPAVADFSNALKFQLNASGITPESSTKASEEAVSRLTRSASGLAAMRDANYLSPAGFGR